MEYHQIQTIKYSLFQIVKVAIIAYVNILRTSHRVWETKSFKTIVTTMTKKKFVCLVWMNNVTVLTGECNVREMCVGVSVCVGVCVSVGVWVCVLVCVCVSV